METVNIKDCEMLLDGEYEYLEFKHSNGITTYAIKKMIKEGVA